MFINSSPSNSLTGANTSISIFGGETVALAITIYDNTGTAIDISGYTFKMTIDFDTPVNLTTANGGITTVSAVNGQIQLNMSSSTTAVINPQDSDYDLWMISSGGITTPLIAGTFSVTTPETSVT